MKKIEIDEETCISCGLCANIAENVFEVLPGEVSKVKEGADLEAEKEKIDQAIAQCPVQAISWSEDDLQQV